MGLGAFTKVVGDAGVTVAKQATLPVTTGNSYSASGALWAAHAAIRKLGVLPVDDDGLVHGKTMVVGASGAIGSVCARLLALASDEVWLVSPETAKLLALKHDIEQQHPRYGTLRLPNHGASSKAGGTRVVLPAPGGASSTTRACVTSVANRSGRTASMGRRSAVIGVS